MKRREIFGEASAYIPVTIEANSKKQSRNMSRENEKASYYATTSPSATKIQNNSTILPKLASFKNCALFDQQAQFVLRHENYVTHLDNSLAKNYDSK